MSIRRMMMFGLSLIKNLVTQFKTRVLGDTGVFEAETCLENQLSILNNQNVLDTASLIVTSNGYKEGKLYSVKPDKVGTNLLLRSEEFNISPWSPILSETSVSSNFALAPDGTLTADKIRVEVGGVNNGRFTQTGISVTPNTTYTLSFYCKNISITNVLILIPNSTLGGLGSNYRAEINTSTWTRVVRTFTVDSGIASISFQITRGGNTGEELLLWGAQLVPGSSVTDYIPTSDGQIINGTIGDFTVTRATIATRVNTEGLIETVPYNLLNRTEEFSNATWIKQQTTLFANTILSPNGTLTADSLIANSGVTYTYTGASGVNIVNQSRNETTIHTISFYLKYNGLNRVRVMYGASTNMTNTIYVEVDLQLGIITGFNYGSVASNGFIENVGNGWYRVGFSAIVSLSATNNRFGVGLGDSVKTVANGVDGVYIWGAQLVQGDTRKEYQQITTGLNIPRIDYSNGTCPSILVEPQSTNLLTNSSDVGSSPWGAIGTEVLLFPNQAISPDGTLTAARYLTNEILGRSRLFVSITSGTIYTFSFWAKNISMTQGSFIIAGVGAPATDYISLINTVTWTRISMTFTSTVTLGNANLRLIQGGNVGGEILLWGAQLEASSVLTSYIPTSGTITTRNADVISNTNASTLIGQTEGTIYCELILHKQSFSDGFIRCLLSISDGTLNNRIEIYRFNNQILYDNVVVGAVQFNNSIFTITNFTGQLLKIAITYTFNSVKVFINGVLVNVDTTALIPACNKINIGSNRVGSGQWSGLIKNTTIWKNVVTDTQAINLTTL